MASSYDHVARAFTDYARGLAAPDPPLMCAVPSVLDRTLAPRTATRCGSPNGRPHACGTRRLRPNARPVQTEMVEVFCRYAPDTAGLIVDRAVTTPADRQAITGNLNGNPFQLDMSLDQSLRFRRCRGSPTTRRPSAACTSPAAARIPAGVSPACPATTLRTSSSAGAAGQSAPAGGRRAHGPATASGRVDVSRLARAAEGGVSLVARVIEISGPIRPGMWDYNALDLGGATLPRVRPPAASIPE